MNFKNKIKLIGCVGLMPIILTGCSNIAQPKEDSAPPVSINDSNDDTLVDDESLYFSKEELEKHDIIDITKIDKKLTKVNGEEAITYTLTYKNSTKNDITMETSLGFLRKSGGGWTGPSDEYFKATEQFLKDKNITSEDLAKSEEYQEEFAKLSEITLKAGEEISNSFTIKKSDILAYFDDKDTDNKTSIEELLNGEDLALAYNYMYKLDDDNLAIIEYSQYPNKEVKKIGYIESL